ncbi:NUDIX domain-containing protein [Bosea caraganae]|uniref:NUDIX domain-containing protein n=1 Tax=Bosea caraganae TaxID=2763117 RepID=A0A370L1L5_9HYPH|nr:NUDIX hydrolase [Bosea caraganae]RDJ21421.1 NUDIX domain-containing protein [Bosea caraganae]RDJ23389.1 NUDIX domain-containing protein [Bosea caraganae]
MKKAKRPSGAPRVQVGALPIRRAADGSVEILLVTSRTTQRWVVPKGWPVKGMKDHDAAAREAYEEAGVVGKIEKRSSGSFSYWKRLPDSVVLCEVKLYRLEVERQLVAWPEQGQRRSQWFKPNDAADLVDEAELRVAIRALATGAG